MLPHVTATGAWALARRVLPMTAAALVLAACGSSTSPSESAPTPHPAGPATAPGTLSPARLETIYLDATAAQLCSVQSRVYPDPQQLAEAYKSNPPYPDLTAEQVADFQKRLSSDVSFAAKLTEKIRSTCGASAAPS
jgi:hypothetical protein